MSLIRKQRKKLEEIEELFNNVQDETAELNRSMQKHIRKIYDCQLELTKCLQNSIKEALKEEKKELQQKLNYESLVEKKS